MAEAPARSSKSSPLDSAHRTLGAKLVDFGGWNMPVSYPSGTLAEHLACRNDAAMFDVSHLGTVRVSGGAAFERLQRGFTNNLARIAPGHTQYTHLLDDEASVVDDIIVWWVEDDRFDVMPNASNTDRVREVIGGEDVTDERVIVAVQGPNARAKVATISKGAAAVPRGQVQEVDVLGTPCVIAGTGYTGEDGIEIACPRDNGEQLWSKLLEAGVAPAGLGARDTLRLEAGLPLHGHELGPGITPLQAGLSWVVAWDKGEFTGRSALLAEKEAGVHRKLVGLLFEGRQPAREGSPLLVDGENAGFITSGNFSPVLSRGIGLGFLPPSVTSGDTVSAEARGRLLAAEVVRPPFVRKAGK